MKLVKYTLAGEGERMGHLVADEIVPLASTGGQYQTLTDILEADDPMSVIDLLGDPTAGRVSIDAVTLSAPIDQQEVWAAGVTYTRSRTARMEESESAAACYDKVYSAARPELFFKAMPYRVAGPNQPVRIRNDAVWSVPEPELALVLNSRMRLVGFTIGNDMSSRDIEGENPLYLPQAKVYRGSCALGPVIVPAETLGDPHALGIRLTITRGGATAFEGKTSTARMKRRVEELVQWLFRENDFPHGVILLTGTGIIPPDDFTLQPGDKIAIEIDRIGTLRNTVAALDDQKTL